MKYYGTLNEKLYVCSNESTYTYEEVPVDFDEIDFHLKMCLNPIKFFILNLLYLSLSVFFTINVCSPNFKTTGNVFLITKMLHPERAAVFL